MSKDLQTYTYELTTLEVNLILTLLKELPYKISAPTVRKLEATITAHETVAEEPKHG